MKEPIISVIIPFYGSQSEIEKCLESLLRQNFSFPYEIIIVESGNKPVSVFGKLIPLNHPTRQNSRQE